MESRLAGCGIVAEAFRLDSMELNNSTDARTHAIAFRPDLLVRISTTGSRGALSWTRNQYRVQATDVAERRVVWSSVIEVLDAGYRSGDRSGRGSDLADRLIERLAADRILPACGASPTAVPANSPAPT